MGAAKRDSDEDEGAGGAAHFGRDDEDAPLVPKGGGPPARAARPSSATRLAAALSVRGGTARALLAAGVSLAWMFFSSCLILLNKYILKDLGFPYPMTVSSMGMAASGVFAFLACRVFKVAETVADHQVTLPFYATRMAPVGFFMALTLWSGNTVYLYLTVSFIQMLKAFTPVITMAALFLAHLETPNAPMIASVLVIAAGTALAAWGEVNFNLYGVVVMFISETAEATRLVMTQYLLVGLKMGPFEGVMYLAPACFAWLTLGAALGEWRAIADARALGVAVAHWPLFLAAACMGFLINVLAFATIKLASSLTLKVLGTVKNALLIMAAMALYGEVVTGAQAGGYLLSTLAFLAYTVIKMRQIAAG